MRLVWGIRKYETQKSLDNSDCVAKQKSLKSAFLPACLRSYNVCAQNENMTKKIDISPCENKNVRKHSVFHFLKLSHTNCIAQ